jgi:hypothetical protein
VPLPVHDWQSVASVASVADGWMDAHARECTMHTDALEES